MTYVGQYASRDATCPASFGYDMRVLGMEWQRNDVNPDVGGIENDNQIKKKKTETKEKSAERRAA